MSALKLTLIKALNNQLVCAPAGLGRLNFARSSLRITAPQQ
ncbi:MAG: hypothetical protein ACI910_002861, partial [Oleispira sp.]